MKTYAEELPPGPRRLLKLLDWCWQSWGPANCHPKLAFFADKLKVSERSICRWTAELERCGAVHKQRCGPHPNTYTSRGHIRCAQMRLPSLEDQGSAPEFGDSFGESFAPPPINELFELKENQACAPVGEEMPPPFAAVDTETAAVAGAIVAFRYADGSQPVAAQIIPRVMKIARFYGVSGYVLGATLERVRRRVERFPSQAPQSPRWFAAVVEGELKKRRDGPQYAPMEHARRPVCRPPTPPPAIPAKSVRDILCESAADSGRSLEDELAFLAEVPVREARRMLREEARWR